MEKYWPEKKVKASSWMASGSDGEEVWQQTPIHRLHGRFIRSAKSNIRLLQVQTVAGSATLKRDFGPVPQPLCAWFFLAIIYG